jgi:hypothetical protein
MPPSVYATPHRSRTHCRISAAVRNRPVATASASSACCSGVRNDGAPRPWACRPSRGASPPARYHASQRWTVRSSTPSTSATSRVVFPIRTSHNPCNRGRTSARRSRRYRAYRLAASSSAAHATVSFRPRRTISSSCRRTAQIIRRGHASSVLLVRLGIRLNFGQQYEVAAVSDHALQFGGVGNTEIPNFIYRWTEQEIEKTISSYEPRTKSRFLNVYAFRIPWGRLRILRSRILLLAILAVIPVMKFVFRILPKQANGFAFIVQKSRPPDNLHPWLKWEDGEVAVDRNWVGERYTAAVIKGDRRGSGRAPEA